MRFAYNKRLDQLAWHAPQSLNCSVRSRSRSRAAVTCSRTHGFTVPPTPA